MVSMKLIRSVSTDQDPLTIDFYGVGIDVWVGPLEGGRRGKIKYSGYDVHKFTIETSSLISVRYHCRQKFCVLIYANASAVKTSRRVPTAKP